MTRAPSRVVWSTFGRLGVELVEPLPPRIVAELHQS
jgi:hypothetical protein